MIRSLKFLTIGAGILLAPIASAADFSDPTWPCVQRKVPHLSIGQMWAGPLPPENVELDEDARRVAATIAVRRTTLEEAEQLVVDYAGALEGEKDARLTALFKTVFDQIDRERAQIISGIARYAGKQTGLADKIDGLQQEQATLEAKGDDKNDDEWDRYEELVDILQWETRIYQERAQSLTYVCETPVLLEKRIFAIARSVMNELE